MAFRSARPRKSFDPTDILGRVFGRLCVVAFERHEVDRRVSRYRSHYIYRCRCECGNEIEVVRTNLLTDHTTSCGCLKHRKGFENPGWKGHERISGYMWSRIRRHAKSRDLAFNITLVDAWECFEAQKGRCALTGWPLVLGLSSKQPSTQTASLDRIDSIRGYEKNNIQWVHKDVNQVKWDLSDDRFREICRAVVAHENQR